MFRLEDMNRRLVERMQALGGIVDWSVKKRETIVYRMEAEQFGKITGTIELGPEHPLYGELRALYARAWQTFALHYEGLSAQTEAAQVFTSSDEVDDGRP